MLLIKFVNRIMMYETEISLASQGNNHNLPEWAMATFTETFRRHDPTASGAKLDHVECND